MIQISRHVLENMSVEDWKHALFQLDENQNLNIQRWLVDIEHLTVVLYDIIHKNMVRLPTWLI